MQYVEFSGLISRCWVDGGFPTAQFQLNFNIFWENTLYVIFIPLDF
jgi:hypothetical protein